MYRTHHYKKFIKWYLKSINVNKIKLPILLKD